MGKRDVDVTIKGKNQASGAFTAAGGDVASFGKRILGLLNPINLLKGGLASLGVLGFGALAKKSVEAAAEADAAWGRVESAVGNAGITFGRVRGDLDELFTSIQKTTRFSDDQAADAFSTLMSITQDYTGSVRNLTLATDIAAAKKIDLKAAAELVGKAMIGETGALKKQGIVIDENADAIAELGKRFTGFAERDASTLQGQLVQVANAWDNVLESMGRALSGMSGGSSVTGQLTETLNALGVWIDENRSNVDALGQSLAYVLEQLGQIPKAVVMAGEGFGEVGSILTRTYYQATNWMRSDASKVNLKAEDAGDADYYKALGRIRARRERTKREEIAASEAQKTRTKQEREAAEAAQKQRLKDAKDQEKQFAKLQDDLKGETMPKVGISLGEGKPITLREATLGDAQASAGALAEAIDTAQMDKATQSVFDLRDAIDEVATGSLRNMVDTWAEATEAIVSGSDSVGNAIGKAIRRGVGSAMMAQGKKNLLEASAIAIEGLYNPVDWARAAKLFGIGTAQIATGSLFAGGGGGGGGSAGGSGAPGGIGPGGFQQQRDELDREGEGVIVIEGDPYLDMSNPRIEDALAGAINKLGKKRVLRFVYSPGGA